VDRLGVFGGHPNAHWAVDVDAERFRALLLERLAALAGSR
jgi:inosine-uridine nucleoside N-ribohydrolase